MTIEQREENLQKAIDVFVPHLDNPGGQLLRDEAMAILSNPQLKSDMQLQLKKDSDAMSGLSIIDAGGVNPENHESALELTRRGITQDFFADGSSIENSSGLKIHRNSNDQIVKYEKNGYSISKHDDDGNWYYHNDKPNEDHAYIRVNNPAEERHLFENNEPDGSVNLKAGTVVEVTTPGIYDYAGDKSLT
ncbi:MAG: hypothetical protein JST89_04185 [Cyanobacteria bacterium SZAS-4]|nr:hypothetical protein [Cyanobacteria bacterium SZAS-4]